MARRTPSKRAAARRPSSRRKAAARRPAKRRARRPARSARAKAARRPAARRRAPAKRAVAKRSKKPTPRATKPAKRAVAARPTKRAAKRPVPAAKRPVVAAKPIKPTIPAPRAARPKAVGSAPPASRPVLDRNRRRLPDSERLEPALEADDRMLSAARTGHDEMRQALEQHHETSPAMTAGDVDADWQDAYAGGDEAPGGDNPTPDQDRVDDIGKALGVNYGASEELKASDKITERDRHRWELDPASSDDWPHER
jgi:Family of unknown function (DUF6335)